MLVRIHPGESILGATGVTPFSVLGRGRFRIRMQRAYHILEINIFTSLDAVQVIYEAITLAHSGINFKSN
jgi:hypothetical protein